MSLPPVPAILSSGLPERPFHSTPPPALPSTPNPSRALSRAHLSCLQKRKHPGCAPSFLVPVSLQLLKPHQEGLFGRARPPGGPSPRDSERTVRKLPLRTGRPAVGPCQACRAFASFPDLLPREVAKNSDAPPFRPPPAPSPIGNWNCQLATFPQWQHFLPPPLPFYLPPERFRKPCSPKNLRFIRRLPCRSPFETGDFLTGFTRLTRFRDQSLPLNPANPVNPVKN
jgi:hypothetical protein